MVAVGRVRARGVVAAAVAPDSPSLMVMLYLGMEAGAYQRIGLALLEGPVVRLSGSLEPIEEFRSTQRGSLGLHHR